MAEPIYTLKNYGSISIKLKEVMTIQGISRSRLGTMTAMSYDLINRYYYNKVTRVDLDVIARFCFALNCNVNDILEYKKD